MCGFAGAIDTAGGAPSDRLYTTVRAMAGAIRHRGPDDDGAWTDQGCTVGLGFQRLAVIDLSAAGHQPQASHDGRWIVAFNGEIYNHLELRAQLAAGSGAPAWRGHSDTETLLACVAA